MARGSGIVLIDITKNWQLNPREMVEHLYHIVQQNLTKEQFNNLSEVVYLF